MTRATPKTAVVRLLVGCVIVAAAAAARAATPDAARAGTVEVSAALDLTDGYARVGNYVPVRLRVANRTGERITDLRLSAGGPLEVAAPMELGPGDVGETVLPVLFVGSVPAPAVDFFAAGRHVARATVEPLAVRRLADEDVLVAVPAGTAAPEGPDRDALARALGARAVHCVSLEADAIALARRFGALDARIAASSADAEAGGLVAARGPDGAWTLSRPRFPPGVESPAQPEAYRLLASEPWPAAERARLWLWLGLVCLGVPAVGLWVSRRRAVLAAVAMLVLAGAAVALIASFGDLRRTRTIHARVLYAAADRPEVAVEHLVLLESRGGAAGRFDWGAAPRASLPVPVLPSAADLFRPIGTLRLAGGGTGPGTFEAARQDGGRVLLRILSEVLPADVTLPGGKGWQSPEDLAATDAAVQSLRVEAGAARDAHGESRPLAGWAAAWRDAADPDLAYSGRSLAWWAAQRREGEGPVRLVWFRESLRPAGRGEQAALVPTLLVYAAPAGAGGQPESDR